MKVSEIKIQNRDSKSLWNTGFRIETKTDAYRVIYNEKEREKYIAEYGDVETVFDKKYNVYRVPALAEKIREYSEMKSADCAIWGSE